MQQCNKENTSFLSIRQIIKKMDRNVTNSSINIYVKLKGLITLLKIKQTNTIKKQ